MKNKTNHILEIIVLIFFFFTIFFLRWFDVHSFLIRKVVQLMLLISFFILNLILNSKKYIKFNAKTISSILLFFMYVAMNVIILGKKVYFTKELLLYVVLPLFSFVSVLFLNNDKNFKDKIFKVLTPIFNIYYVINLIIMILQINIPYFMMRTIPEGRMMYEDQIDGLIGMNGTHILSFFCIFVILLNYLKYLESKDKKSLRFMIFIILSSSIISLFNENKSLYVFLFIVFIFVAYNSLPKGKIKKKYLLFAIFGVCFLFSLNMFFSYIDTSSPLATTYNNYKTLIINRNQTERTLLYEYALEKGNGYRIGMGIGSIMDYGDPNLPLHFGLNNVSSLVYQGGLIYLFFTILLYLELTLTLVQKPSFKFKISCIVFLVFVCYYTQPFSENYFTFLMGFILLELSTIVELNQKKLRGENND